MSPPVIALIAFLCIFCIALLGLYLRCVLPEHHLSEESGSAIKLATGLIATIAALVLGLLISSAKSTFDTVKRDLVHNAASIVRLDRLLSQYGRRRRNSVPSSGATMRCGSICWHPTTHPARHG